MAVKPIIVNTPENITQSDAQDWATIFNSIFGDISGIIRYGNEMKAVKINNNAVKLLDGVCSTQGHIIKIDKDTFEQLVIESGTLGMNRKDAIVVEYIKSANPEHNDTFEFKVIKGIPKAKGYGTPDLPKLVAQDLHTGGTTRQELLYEVIINDDAIASLDRAANVIDTLDYTVNNTINPLITKTKNLPADGSFDPNEMMKYVQSGKSYVVKYENGLMLMALHIEGTTDANGRVTTVFPEAFIDTPLPVGMIGLNVSMRILNTIAFNFTSSQITTTSYNISTNNMSTNNNIVYAALLIGRYK